MEGASNKYHEADGFPGSPGEGEGEGGCPSSQSRVGMSLKTVSSRLCGQEWEEHPVGAG